MSERTIIDSLVAGPIVERELKEQHARSVLFDECMERKSFPLTPKNAQTDEQICQTLADELATEFIQKKAVFVNTQTNVELKNSTNEVGCDYEKYSKTKDSNSIESLEFTPLR